MPTIKCETCGMELHSLDEVKQHMEESHGKVITERVVKENFRTTGWGVKWKKNELVKVQGKKANKLLTESIKELEEDIKKSNKLLVVNKLKQVRMAEMTVVKLKDQLKVLLETDGLTEEEYLFGDV